MKTSTWETFWFRPSTPAPLALCRILFFGWLFIWYFRFDFAAVGLYPPELWRPLQLLNWTGLGRQPSPETLHVLGPLWKAALLCSCAGVLTRFSTLLSFGLGAYLLALTHSFHKINHSDGLLVVAMGVLALSHCADRWSIDSLFRRKILHQGRTSDRSGEYTWPSQAIRLAFLFLFFGAGLSKVLVGGLAWMFSDNLQNILAYCALTRDPLLPMTFLPGWAYKALAVGTVVFELLAPLALFRWPRVALVLGLLGMQIGIRLTMGDNFTQFMALYLFWLPWERILALLARSRARTAAPSSGYAPERINPTLTPSSH